MPTLGGWEWVVILLCLGCFAVLAILIAVRLVARRSSEDKGERDK
jgi:hypothetical protein